MGQVNDQRDIAVTMDRRHFSKLVVSGIVASALLPAMTCAQSFETARSPASVRQAQYASLLDRARTALDHHQREFDLRDRIALADFSVASRDLRFHIVDLISGQSWSYLVAHGKGSDPEHSGFLQYFSNETGSLATSSGTYKTGDIYEGIHGRAMRLTGLDTTNDQADSRAIVLHSAPYVSEDHIATWGKVGRSEGCFVVAPHMLEAVLALLGPGRLLYADKVIS